MKKILSILLLGALLLLCFSGCTTLGNTNDGDNSTDDVNDNVNNVTDGVNDNNVNTIIVGTKPSNGGGPVSQYALSATIPERYELSETGIPFSVSYGVEEGTGVNWDCFADIVLKVGNKDGHVVILKALGIGEILKPDYTVKRLWDDNHEQIIGFEYSCTESYALPLSLFSGDSGEIWINLVECNRADPDGPTGAGAGTTFYYTRYGTSIYISTEIQDS